MLTAAETARLTRIKHAAQRGDGRIVSRADKQWCLDIAAREGKPQSAKVLQRAAEDGYNVNNIPMCV